MLDGKKPAECSYCWQIEDTGNLSDRHYRSGEPWAADDFETIVEKGSQWNVVPKYVEIDINSACNLTCSYCSPQYSSKWMEHSKQFGAYPTNVPHNDPSYFEGPRRPIPHREHNPYVEAFWKWWPTLYPELRHFRLTGGEPLLDRNLYKILEWVHQNPKPNLHLAVTSNFSVEDSIFDNYLEQVSKISKPGHVEHFQQYVSLDSIGKQAEYMRAGMRYERVMNNVRKFLTQIPSANSVNFIITTQALSVFGLHGLMEQIFMLRQEFSNTYQRIWFDTPLLHSPNWMTVNILPDRFKSHIIGALGYMDARMETPAKRFKGFKDYEYKKVNRVLDWWKDNEVSGAPLFRKMSDFYNFYNEYDRRHGFKFAETFPELTNFYRECKINATQPR